MDTKDTKDTILLFTSVHPSLSRFQKVKPKELFKKMEIAGFYLLSDTEIEEIEKRLLEFFRFIFPEAERPTHVEKYEKAMRIDGLFDDNDNGKIVVVVTWIYNYIGHGPCTRDCCDKDGNRYESVTEEETFETTSGYFSIKRDVWKKIKEFWKQCLCYRIYERQLEATKAKVLDEIFEMLRNNCWPETYWPKPPPKPQIF